MLNLKTLPDQKILELCQRYGEQTRFWRQKFIGLPPEVNRRKLYQKKNFSSIFEFAKKLAGLSEEQVRNALNLDKNFEDKPLLKKMFVNGEVSMNKLIRITSVATQGNEEFWANQVQILPQKALETLVRDERHYQKFENLNDVQKPFFEDGELRAQLATPEKSDHLASKFGRELELSPAIKEKLLELQQKGIDLNQLLQEFLDKREEDIQDEKEKIAEELKMNVQIPVATSGLSSARPASRYIPAKIRKLLHKEYGTKCSIPNCQKTAQVTHHSQRFTLAHLHDPRYLAPLCREHHVIAHSIDVKFKGRRVGALVWK